MHPLDPRLHAVTNRSIYTWRSVLKQALLIERKYTSDLSGLPLTLECEMHEGILTRAEVPRGVRWHYMLFHPFNSFLLLPHEHRPQPPSREWCVKRAFALYGKESVVEWYYSLPFKVVPRRIENLG